MLTTRMALILHNAVKFRQQDEESDLSLNYPCGYRNLFEFIEEKNTFKLTSAMAYLIREKLIESCWSPTEDRRKLYRATERAMDNG